MKKFIIAFSILLISSSSFAKTFSINGTIKRTLASHRFNGCMIAMDKSIGNSCPSSWVSLDCNDKFFANGKLRYSSAIAAATAGKRIQVYIDNQKKAGSYCTAYRLDVLY